MTVIYSEKEKRADEIWLQGIGWNPAIKASELKPGMVTVWNYGEKELVKSVSISKSGKTISSYIVCDSGYEAIRRLKADRLVGISAY